MASNFGSNSRNNSIKFIKLNSFLTNVKCKYILKIIFDNLSKLKLLEIIKYNKTIQNRLDININNYKKYSQEHTLIEIELKPVQNKNGIFINYKKEDESFYHIYFDDNKEEIKRYNLTKEDKVNKINIIIDPQVKSFNKLFSHCKCIESINFKKFYRKKILKLIL